MAKPAAAGWRIFWVGCYTARRGRDSGQTARASQMRHSVHTPSVGQGHNAAADRSLGRCGRSPGRFVGRIAAPLCVIAGLGLVWAVGSHGLAAQRAVRPLAAGVNGSTGQFWTMTTPLDDGRQMLLLLDQQSRCLAIYHVDPGAGTVQLKSTRDITWDLMIEEFNAQEPKPSSLKKMAEMPK
jgi:hypothetical protein